MGLRVTNYCAMFYLLNTPIPTAQLQPSFRHLSHYISHIHSPTQHTLYLIMSEDTSSSTFKKLMHGNYHSWKLKVSGRFKKHSVWGIANGYDTLPTILASLPAGTNIAVVIATNAECQDFSRISPFGSLYCSFAPFHLCSCLLIKHP